MPPTPRDPFDELQFTAVIGDGILYLFCTKRKNQLDFRTKKKFKKILENV